MGVIAIGGTVNARPQAPTLQSPVNGLFLDLATNATFLWQYNPGQPGQSQTYWLFERRINNSQNRQFWNASTGAWQSSAYWNSNSPTYGTLTNQGTIYTYVFPDGAWTDGITYQWAMACQDGNGQGPLSTFAIVTAQQLPVVTVAAPSGSITQANPTVVWSTVFAPGATQLTYQVIIYNAAQYTAGGFTPGQGSNVYSTVVIGGNATTLDLTNVPLYLPTGVTYRAYVQVVETNALASAWAYSEFNTNYTAPVTDTPVATVTADPTTQLPMIQITAGSAATNLLSTDDADPTLGIGTWYNAYHAAVSSTVDGLQMAPTVPGTMVASTAIGLAGYAVTAGSTYTAIATYTCPTESSPCATYINFYDSSGSQVGYLQSTGITDGTSPVQDHVTGTAPAGSVYAAVAASVDSANDGHYVTAIGLFAGTNTTWTPGGGGGGGTSLTGQAIIQRSDGAFVRGASINNPYTITSGAIVVNDYEAIPQVEYTYALQIIQTSGTTTIASDFTFTDAVTLITNRWWEFDPNNPADAIQAQAIAWQPVRTEQSTARLVLGQATPNVVSSSMGGIDGQATFETFDPLTYQGLQSILTSQTTIFVSSPWGPTDSTYVRFGPQSGGGGGGTGNKVQDSTLMASTYANMHRTTQVTFVAQARPPV